MSKRDVKVANYTTRREMEHDVKKMLKRGYRLESQSGELSPWLTTPFMKRKKITVVWTRD